MTSAWLKCSVEPGMLPNEYAVGLETTNAGKVSLFAFEHDVRTDEGLLRVSVLDDNHVGGVLVRLPAHPFEVSNRNVRVARDMVVSETE